MLMDKYAAFVTELVRVRNKNRKQFMRAGREMQETEKEIRIELDKHLVHSLLELDKMEEWFEQAEAFTEDTRWT